MPAWYDRVDKIRPSRGRQRSSGVADDAVPVGPDVPDQRVGADLLRTGGGGRVARADQRVDHLASGQVPTGGDRDERPVPVGDRNVAGGPPSTLVVADNTDGGQGGGEPSERSPVERTGTGARGRPRRAARSAVKVRPRPAPERRSPPPPDRPAADRNGQGSAPAGAEPAARGWPRSGPGRDGPHPDGCAGCTRWPARSTAAAAIPPPAGPCTSSTRWGR